VVRALLSVLVLLIANALGLILADVLLDDVTINASGFMIALLIFTGIEIVIQPLIIQLAMRHARALSGSSALLASFVALVVTAWISDGLQIHGATAWLLATVIVWAAALLAGLLLPALVFKRWMAERAAR
jgi:putative membrane protein